MADNLSIDGLGMGGHLTVPSSISSFDVKVAKGTIRLIRAQQSSDRDVLPIAIKTEHLEGAFTLEDGSGRLVLSWSSSESSSITQPSNNTAADTLNSQPIQALPVVSPVESLAGYVTDTEASGSAQPLVIDTIEGPTAGSMPPPSTRTTSNTRPRSSRLKGARLLTQKQRCHILIELEQLMKLKDAEPFVVPIDTRRYPHYSKAIKDPMDFGTIVGNFRSSNSHYPSVDAIMADINLVTNNAIKFNGERHQISQNARNAKAWFTKRMKDLPEDGDREISGSHGTRDSTETPSIRDGDYSPSQSHGGIRDVEDNPPFRSTRAAVASRFVRETVEETPQPKRMRMPSIGLSDAGYRDVISSRS